MVERYDRLETRHTIKIRPVTLKLVDCHEKTHLLRNSEKLKCSGLYVIENFSGKVCHVRKKLWESTAENRNRNETVQLLFDKVTVNRNFYAWDETNHDSHFI